MTSKYRYLIPNGITFLSLMCGVISIFSSATGKLGLAGALILTSYILDMFDGALARRLNARSNFGLQLDSLVDMVSLGMAPATLVFMRLQESDLSPVLVWPIVTLIPMAGAFRLARFNLLPAKLSGSADSMGLTISTAGATQALAVLSDLSLPTGFLPDTFYPILLLTLCVLMVSTIRFPSLAWVVSRKRLTVVFLSVMAVSLLFWPFVLTWFMFTNGYLGVSLVRAGILMRGGQV
ncbi:MAG: CDP-alcohol phosphatidyltransferase family protein [Anaerolineales bacterium]|nr:CDP-alcohol phosphatidyltransferase family protein [Anaerolineales bacterium]MCB8951466.1 CDP-alcohol phosphatidyltransferase family protein [Ardenticatenales bacterium]